jgi:hypothetical protein
MDLRKVGGVIIAVVAGVGIMFGSKMMSKANAAKDVKGRLVAICAENKDCMKAVALHFDSCFDEHYNYG